MTINRQMSKRSWQEIDDLLHKIMFRAARIKDGGIYGHADRCTALLRNLATEILIEDARAAREAE